MKVFGISGWSGSGKTTLLVRLIPVLVGRGIRVATIKHTHHVPAIAGGDDGAVETVVAAADRFAILHALGGDAEPNLEQLTSRLSGIDLVLVEGFKFGSHPKLEVWDAELGKELRAPGDPTVVAVACDGAAPVGDRPVFARGDLAGIAAFIVQHCGLDAS